MVFLINYYRYNPIHNIKINWQWLDFYYNDDSSIIPKEIIYTENGDCKTFYEFNSKEGNYNQTSEEDFARMLNNGLCLSNVYKFEHYNCYEKYKWIDELKIDYSSNSSMSSLIK